jgi:glutathione synthase/RimK-type ligase-like ATP-grasp enzyme
MKMHAFAGEKMDDLFLDHPDGTRIALNEVGAVWYRRIRAFTIDPAITDETGRTFAWSETNEAMQGVWYAMDCFWMNPPVADEVALRKVTQLRLAKRAGLSIPETLVTNGPDEARAFIDMHRDAGVVRKAFRNIQQAPRETRLVGEPEMAMLDSVKYAPVIFQRFVPADLDLRVTIVDGEIFAAAFKSDADHQVDYRSGIGTAQVSTYQLPDNVADNLLKFVDGLGLKYGAVDFRVTPDGEHIFLEINPAGEYLYVSERTGLPIPQAIAAALERHCKG